VCAEEVDFRPDPAVLFGKELPLCLEIGCGKGDFITQLSAREPDFGFYAMEKVDDVLVVAVEKYAVSRNLGKMGPNGGWLTPDGELYRDGAAWDIPMELRGNVRFRGGDAKNLGERFPANTFSCIYANFSDPWPKKGYESRRLTSPEFLKLYESLLIDVGYFRFKTDNVDLFEYSVETVSASPFEITFLTRDLHASEHNEGNVRTEYEENFASQGMKINMLEVRKPMGYTCDISSDLRRDRKDYRADKE
jgi:tRNA (guanine-N7-)-methyltransferase